MTLRVIESGELVQHVFWLDLRTRSCGVRLWHPQTNAERCGELKVADFVAIRNNGVVARLSVENILGERAQEILRDE